MKYKVITPLRHNKKDYAPGEQVEMNEKQARQAIASGAIAAPEKEKKDEK